jgi:hypothetical protein
MRAIFSIASLVIVLCIIAITVQHQLRASRQIAPSAVPAEAAAAFGGASQPTAAQYQRELERTLKNGSAQRAATDAAETSH